MNNKKKVKLKKKKTSIRARRALPDEYTDRIGA